jgi:hypothetical protein
MSALAASPLVLDRTPRMMRLAPLATSLMVASKPMPEFFVDVSATVFRVVLLCEPYRASNDDGLASEIDVIGVGACYLSFYGSGQYMKRHGELCSGKVSEDGFEVNVRADAVVV